MRNNASKTHGRANKSGLKKLDSLKRHIERFYMSACGAKNMFENNRAVIANSASLKDIFCVPHLPCSACNFTRENRFYGGLDKFMKS